ncbi:PhzF family phenazine biosynthesis protein [Tsukamurella sp. 8F]|uniref:PhzF family phenazine biosynthesis protein n=1 Tax=unclassified Tsukamurella TaxID=2633480 RepID=UPI0023B947AC|nr:MULTISPECIES: PhzF family phenazine biosynthesis protein [unclassified Tsukamurella]MDF0530696.1 PhzF family phenazine biosynthesis protein [Tsukamurella sp. 8J]MDF0587897.1 PhzF family phenazine biosynthesis protein [Tsukamurella sp. 8F]
MSAGSFSQVDVFSTEPFGGNPVAVVHDASDWSDDDMARFARWTNLSETTFLLPPSTPAADYRLRIFTPGGELPFAGHPTLGSCHAWLEAGNSPQGEAVVQECGVGLVTLRETGAGLAFAAPPLRRSGPVDADVLARATYVLGLTADDVLASSWVDNGPPWLGLMLRDAGMVLGLRPDFVAMGDLFVGVVGRHPDGAEPTGGPADVEVRAFCPGAGVNEDPVTGSLNAGLAQWLLGAGVLQEPYTAAQGTAIGRSGRVHVTRDGDGTVWVAGATVTRIAGSVR